MLWRKACHSAQVSATQLSAQQAEGTTLCLINQRRAKRGLARLKFNGSLAAAAKGHSAEMDALNFFDHESPGGSSPLSRITSAGYLSGASAWGVGENLAWAGGDAGSPTVIVGMWMNSPGHRQIMLSRSFQQVGIGVVVGSPDGDDPDGAIYTADFGYRH
jgi:uncharacterized protein YkwD